MLYPNKFIYHYGAAMLSLVIFIAFIMGYAMGHGVMLHDCKDIMSSRLPVPSPIYAFKG